MTESQETGRILLLAAEPVIGRSVLEELRRGRGADADATVMVVAPALADSPLKHAMGDVDEGRERAERVLSASLTELEQTGASLEGRIGDADPILAVEDALAEFDAEEIVIVTGPDGDGPYLEEDVFERARERFDQRVTRLAVDRPGANARVDKVERSDSSTDARRSEAEIDPDSRNLPRLSVRDVAGIAVAAIGTIVLIVLAAECGGDTVQRDIGTDGVGSDGGCVFRYIAAGVMALLNIAHVVGLMFFESVGYRGLAARAFAWMSLVGTPVAIVLSLLIH